MGEDVSDVSNEENVDDSVDVFAMERMPRVSTDKRNDPSGENSVLRKPSSASVVHSNSDVIPKRN